MNSAIKKTNPPRQTAQHESNPEAAVEVNPIKKKAKMGRPLSTSKAQHISVTGSATEKRFLTETLPTLINMTGKLRTPTTGAELGRMAFYLLARLIDTSMRKDEDIAELLLDYRKNNEKGYALVAELNAKLEQQIASKLDTAW